MIKKFCPNCKQTCLHNAMRSKTSNETPYRCTNCGYPVPNHNMNEMLKKTKLEFAAKKATRSL